MEDRDLSFKDIVAGVGSMVMSAGLAAVVSGPVMSLLGFRFDSVWSFLLFFVLSALVSWPLGCAALAAPRWLKLSGRDALMIYLPLDTLASLLGFVVMDHLMDSVTGNVLSLGLTSLIFTLPGIPELKRLTAHK